MMSLHRANLLASINAACVWLGLLCALAMAAPAHAVQRDYFFDHIGSEQGLAQNTVHVVFQDAKGFIWIGTEGALHRYDGYTVVLYEHNPTHANSLPGSLITALADAPDGQLWIGTETGELVRFDPLHERVTARVSMSAHAVDSLFDDAQGRLWIGQGNGVSVLPTPSAKVKTVRAIQHPNVAFLEPSVGGFAQCADGTLYAASHDGLLRFASNASSGTVLGTSAPVTALVCDQQGQLFVSDAKGVAQVNRSSGARKPVWSVKSGSDTIPGALALEHDGALWLALQHVGLLRIGKQGRDVQRVAPIPGMPHTLPRADVTRLLVDRSGLLWVGTKGDGVVRTQPSGARFQLTRNTSAPDAAAANNIRAIYHDAQQRYWIGTRGAGLQRYDPATHMFADANAALRKALKLGDTTALSIFAIAPAAAGAMWLASDSGALYFDPAANHARIIDLGLPAGQAQVRSVLADNDGSVWFGTLGHGVLHYRAGVGVVHRYTTHDGLADDRIFTLVRDAKHRLWVGTLNGLSLFDPLTQRFRSFREDPAQTDSLAGNRVIDLYSAPDGPLWVGTSGGLNKLRSVDASGAHFRRYLRSDNLPDQTIYCIRDGAHQRLWVSTNLGISRLDTTSGDVRTFGLRDGLQGLEFNSAACLRGADGRLWFGGVHGLNSIHPGETQASQFLPPVVITSVRFGSAPAQPAAAFAQPLQVAQSMGAVRFHFAALDYTAPSDNLFEYRLVGLDPRWSKADSEPSAAFTNLAPGSYRFEVRGSNHDGRFNPTATSLAFAVTPPWWASRMAKALAVLLALLVLAAAAIAVFRRQRAKRRHHRELKERDTHLRLALFGSGGQFWDWDIRANTLHRIGAEQLIGGEHETSMSIDEWRSDAVHPDDLANVEHAYEEYFAGNTDRFDAEYRLKTMQGEWLWVHARGKIAERDAGGEPLRVCGTIHNITAQRLAERDRRIASAVIRSMSEAVTVTDLDFHFVSVNLAFARMTGYREDEVLGRDAALLDCHQHAAQTYRDVRQSVRDTGRWSGELWLRCKDGEEILCWMELKEVWDSGGKRSHFVNVLSDITERKRSERALRYMANYDALTGLPNRSVLNERLRQAIERAQQDGNKVAVMFIDLDRFKQVNDSMGHAIGDRMLKAAGERLRGSVREADTVARFGGDEFAVVLEDIHDSGAANMVAHLIIEAFTTPLRLDSGQQVSLSPSIGMALFPDHSQSAGDLLKFADTAMYQAKERGRNTWAIYTKAMDVNARYHATLLTALRQAMENNELRLAYQPKMAIDSGKITGAEALLRWTSPSLGDIPPSVFIPLAEEGGLIVEIGEFVLGRACATLAQWHRAGLSDLTMAVNVAAAQLLGRSLLDHLRAVLASNDLNPASVELELTEGSVMGDPEASLRTLLQMREIGVRLAVDDFGTGYSSLAYLKRLPINTLKIDQTFVRDLPDDADDAAITISIINMAHTLGLHVVAEGVETSAQLAYLRDHQCDEMQGNWLSVPLPADACLAFIREHIPGTFR